MVSSKDVQHIVSLLSSDKAKCREEGVKLLHTWMDGERAINFCQYLGRETARIKPAEIPHSESWPFLVSLLVQCVTSEVSSCKRRTPKISFAKSLRVAIQRAEDTKLSGKPLPLLPIVRTLFGHVWDILSSVPGFQTEYAVILRLLLSSRDYRFHLRSRIYNNLAIFYFEKIQSTFPLGVSNQKEELFRCILTLHSLLENPPGDFNDECRGICVERFVNIFSSLREENKISRKLIECVNTFLLKDGPNLGTKYVEIHTAVWHFTCHVWNTTHDRGLKEILYSYANILLNLVRGTSQDDCLVDQILDLVCKDLDLASTSSTSYLCMRGDALKDDKAGSNRVLNCKLVELAARVLYRACSRTMQQCTEKRIKREPMNVVLREALTRGNLAWHSAFIFLVRKYFNCMNEEMFLYWFEGISSSLERAVNNTNYDGLLWTLRSLLELSIAFDVPSDKPSSSFSRNSKFYSSWQLVWNCLINGLPLFSNLQSLVDVALVLLGNIIRCDQATTCAVPSDFWDLKLFQRPPSVSLLYFFACYFSHKASQVDFRDTFRLRKHLLYSTFSILQKDRVTIKGHMVHIFPAAVFSLAASSLVENNYATFLRSISFADPTESEAWKYEEKECDLFDCSVETLVRIDVEDQLKSRPLPSFGGAHLPQDLTGMLLNEMECGILGALEDDEIENMSFSDTISMCALLSNMIWGITVLRGKEKAETVISKVGNHLIGVVDRAVNEMKNNDDFIRFQASLDSDEFRFSLLSSLRSFIDCPLFFVKSQQFVIDRAFYGDVVNCAKRILDIFVYLYNHYSTNVEGSLAKSLTPDFPTSSDSSQNLTNSTNSAKTIVDLDLDVDGDRQNVTSVGGKQRVGLSVPTTDRKIFIISLISSLSPILNSAVWDVLFELMNKENDDKVCEIILYCLCQRRHCSSFFKIECLVSFVGDMMLVRQANKLGCRSIITAINQLLCSINSMKSLREENEKEFDPSLMEKKDYDEVLKSISLQLVSISEAGLLDWLGRSVLVEAICNMVVLSPTNAQTMISNLLLLLQDSDYRVRMKLARRICVLFQTWDGHKTLFEDICSSLGLVIVVPIKGKRVTFNEVLAAGPQPYAMLETAVIFFMHLSYFSEKIELEAIFIMCAISALNACLRELVDAAFDELSTRLGYSTRFKYLEHLLGPILFYCVACGITLNALMEIRQHFISELEPSFFVQYCCQWLLPALLLYNDNKNLKLVSQITNQSLEVICRDNFVSVFSVCICLICSTDVDQKAGGADVLKNSFLQIASLSDVERDKLIKKHMVSIVSRIVSLTSCTPDPPLPLFSSKTIALATRKIVDGFLDINDLPNTGGIIDRINMFRPDRVFMFILEIHYQIEAASNMRHKRDKLSGLEVLVHILGERASVLSTTTYVLNLVGQWITSDTLGEQCCRLISDLLDNLNISDANTLSVLGEQLQFLVPKLVADITVAKVTKETVNSQMNLLSRLIMDSSPRLNAYIMELEPFPILSIFDELRNFHDDLCVEYSSKQHLLNIITRSSYLPPKLLFWSVRALHQKWPFLENMSAGSSKKLSGENDTFLHDAESLDAVWNLVYLCQSSDADNIKPLVCDFVCKAGINDLNSVVIHLRGTPHYINVNNTNNNEIYLDLSSGMSEELLASLVQLLGKYLIDDSAKIVHTSSQALRGILSTEKGQKALLKLNLIQRSIVKIHSNGINAGLIEQLLSDLEERFRAESIPLESSDLWKTNGKNFNSWICPLVYSLIGSSKDVILKLCLDVILLKAELAELLLPGVIVNIARINEANVNLHKLLSCQMESYIFTETNKLNKSIQVFLDALNELRICYILESSKMTQQKLPSSKHGKYSTHVTKSPATSLKAKDSLATSNLIGISSTWEKVYWVAIDYLIVAKSAMICGMYFTAMMYVEHWCEDRFGELTLGESDFSHMEVVPEHIEILLSAATQINEPDGLYGIIRSHTLSSQAIIYEHEGSWNKALEYYDLQIRTGGALQKARSSETILVANTKTCDSYPDLYCDATSRPYKGLIRSLQQIGCTHVLDLFCHGLTSTAGKLCQDVEFSELQYEAAWRSRNWDFSTITTKSDISLCDDVGKYKHFNYNLHKCLKALQSGDSNDFHKILQFSKQELLRSIACSSVESTEYIFSTIVKLKIFHHVGVAWNCHWPQTLDGCGIQKTMQDDDNLIGENMAWLKADCNLSLNHLQTNMGLLDLIIAFRRVVLHIFGSSELAIQHLLLSSSFLRKGSRFSQAASALHELKFFCTKDGEPFSNSYWFGRLEEAKLLWAQDHHNTAIKLADYVCHNCQPVEVSLDAHRLIGKWLAETRSTSSKTILEKHLKPALSLAEEQLTRDFKGTNGLIKCHFYLAHYTDALYRSYEERLNSSEWKTSLHLRKLKRIELEELIRRFKSSRKEEKDEYSPKIHELQRQLIIDQEEEKRLQDDRDNFLRLALDGYKKTLLTGDKYDVLAVFRLVSLWFNLSSTEDVLQNMSSTISEVPSCKFLALVYQIASRMGSSSDAISSSKFQQLLVSLLKKMALDHPYHTIFQIFALANGDRIKEKQRNRNSFIVDKDKMVTAKSLLQELSSSKPTIIKQMRHAVEVYIKLAELETKREDVGKKALLPRDIRGIKQLEHVPVVTATIPVDRDCQYLDGSFPYFQGLSDSVIIMNGINAPKVVECMGSDGKKYRQLAKSGNDDLRQDAVMEQFFGLVNAFLQKNRDTRQRSLSVRTYKVVPLTPSAGVLEWVNGTLPLGDYLLGSSRNGGAHVRYRQDDWLFAKCRDHMSNEKDKRKAYQNVCKNFRPVLHHFFLERFLQPADWFQKRLAYTRSVASNSMVGYIVGLGDRHSMNILIDQASAEVVHIDLGVAFEQGLMLKTPERVPFRLTRDIIDGMGVTGVEGVFRRCCEETLSVMRTNKEALLTIVEVFIHDPLYKWALSPLKALQRQKDMDDDVEANLEGVPDGYEGNKDATRALIRVKQKLEGYEEGELRSVQGQVQQLIQDAVDPERLCLMYPGWAAWL